MPGGVTLAARASGRDNNFNLVRLCAAALVLVSHSWPLTGTPGEPLEAFAGYSLGHLGVDIFFVVSGFLVTGSLLARVSVTSFAHARALRIFPALALSAFGTALVLGPLVTELPLARYFSDAGTWRYAFQNAVTWPMGVCWWLPGVFSHQPAGPAVNGALWSLPWELTMYVLLAILGVVLLRARWPRAWFDTSILAIAVTATAGHGLNEAMGLSQRFEIVQGLRLVALFFTAGALQIFKDRILLSAPWFAAAALALPGVMWLRGGAQAFYPVLLCYVVLWLALVPGGVLRAYNRLGDYSYGLYLWQFPLQQVIVLHYPGLGPLALTLAALPAALMLAMLSWHLVESRALAFRPPARTAGLAVGVVLILLASGCGKHSPAPPTASPRHYRMGFAANAPRFEFDLLLAALELWTRRADAAIIGGEAPWDSLLAGVPAADYVRRQHVPLAQYYRGKGLRLWVYLDPANGLDRTAEAPALVNAGRSLTEPAIQQLYAEYAVACDTLLHPDVCGLALETNLVRLLSPPALYGAVRSSANGAAAAIRAADAGVQLSASVQVDIAWGAGLGSGYLGIEQDFTDFPFMQVLGLSSYPYFVWATPEQLPANYYSRLVSTHPLPVAVTEGGWTSENFGSIVSSPQLQQRYLTRQAQLLESVDARAWFQLAFTDIEIHSVPRAEGLAPFSRIGLVDTTLAAKPALATWDAQFAKRLQ